MEKRTDSGIFLLILFFLTYLALSLLLLPSVSFSRPSSSSPSPCQLLATLFAYVGQLLISEDVEVIETQTVWLIGTSFLATELASYDIKAFAHRM